MLLFNPFPNILGCFMGMDRAPLKDNGLGQGDLILLKQVHGNQVVELEESGDVEKFREAEADAILSYLPGRPIAIKTADCVPILFAHSSGLTGAVHAGWRGSAQGILFKTLQKVREKFQIKVSEVKMAIGPAICWDHYEVGEEVARQFPETRYPKVLKPHREKFLLDLKQVNLLQALEGGVLEKNLHISSHCVFEDTQFYSYRKALGEGRGEAGRNYSWILMRG